MVKCSFCGNEIAKGTGMMYVKDDASMFYFDRRKCRVSLLKFHRNPRKVRWTLQFVKGASAHGRTDARPAKA